MGEFGAVSVISGNIIGQTQTMTLYVESAYKEYNTGEAGKGGSLWAGDSWQVLTGGTSYWHPLVRVWVSSFPRHPQTWQALCRLDAGALPGVV